MLIKVVTYQQSGKFTLTEKGIRILIKDLYNGDIYNFFESKKINYREPFWALFFAYNYHHSLIDSYFAQYGNRQDPDLVYVAEKLASKVAFSPLYVDVYPEICKKSIYITVKDGIETTGLSMDKYITENCPKISQKKKPSDELLQFFSTLHIVRAIFSSYNSDPDSNKIFL